ncbi:MAG: autoinducer binding domain-containing protein [Amylibacter sp.]
MEKVGYDKQLRQLEELAPAGYVLGLHIRYNSATLMFRTYPEAWMNVYTQNGYMMTDPLVAWGVANQGCSRWSALTVPDPNNVLKQAREFDLNYGIAVSCGLETSRTIGGFARSDREFTDQEIQDVHDIVLHMHRETAPDVSLTPPQVAALRLLADGRSTAQAATDLGITERAVKSRLKTAGERLLTRSTAETLQLAIEYRLL